jgi:hypothetical protein
MRKKLARHFAKNACDNAMKKFSTMLEADGNFDIEATMKKIEQEEKEATVKRNATNGLDRMKSKLGKEQI